MPKEREQREHLDYIYKDRVFSAGYTVSSGMVHVTAVQGRKSGQRCELTDHAVAEDYFARSSSKRMQPERSAGITRRVLSRRSKIDRRLMQSWKVIAISLPAFPRLTDAQLKFVGQK